MSKSQINKLGDRLKRSPSISEEDRELLDSFRETYAQPMQAVAATIAGHLGLEANPRLKTVGTIIDKLRREQGSHLSSIQDIAGVRIVGVPSRREQDDLVSKILDLFPSGKVKDRRAEPSYGYRAVHVIVEVGAVPVEIQVRTQMQHAWAEMIEKVGDRWGREVRYGGVPSNPAVAELVGQLRELADLFATFETTAIAPVEELEEDLAAEEAAFEEEVRSGGVDEASITERRQNFASVRSRLAELRATLVEIAAKVEADKVRIIDLCTRRAGP